MAKSKKRREVEAAAATQDDKPQDEEAATSSLLTAYIETTLYAYDSSFGVGRISEWPQSTEGAQCYAVMKEHGEEERDPAWCSLDEFSSQQIIDAQRSRASQVTVCGGSHTALLRQMVLHRHSNNTLLPLRFEGDTDHTHLTPPHWVPQLEDEASLHTVPPGSDEYKYAAAVFKLRNPTAIVEEVSRVQDVELWQRYTSQLDLRARENGGDANERWLFHGTGATEPKCIWKDGEGGFDLRLSSGHYFGDNAVYFSESAHYSDRKYSHMLCCGQSRHACRCNADGRAQMFLASVACGTHKDYGTDVDKDLKRPPQLPGSTKLYASVNSAPERSHHRMHCIWNNDQAYPRYLVTYLASPQASTSRDCSSEAQEMLRTLGCDGALVNDTLPPPPPMFLNSLQQEERERVRKRERLERMMRLAAAAPPSSPKSFTTSSPALEVDADHRPAFQSQADDFALDDFVMYVAASKAGITRTLVKIISVHKHHCPTFGTVHTYTIRSPSGIERQTTAEHLSKLRPHAMRPFLPTPQPAPHSPRPSPRAARGASAPPPLKSSLSSRLVGHRRLLLRRRRSRGTAAKTFAAGETVMLIVPRMRGKCRYVCQILTVHTHTYTIRMPNGRERQTTAERLSKMTVAEHVAHSAAALTPPPRMPLRTAPCAPARASEIDLP